MKMKVWKFNLKLEKQYCDKDIFISNFSDKKLGQKTWENIRHKIEDKKPEKKYEIIKQKDGIYVFSNGFTKSEILDILKNRELIHHNDKKNIIYLMWRDIIVCKWESSNITEDVRILDIFKLDLMPTGTITNGKVWDSNFADWLKWRSIPYSRKNIKLILQALNIETTEFMIKSCNGAGLNDNYWYKLENSNLKWKDVNYYNNEWYNDGSKLLFLKQRKGTSKKYLNTPDCVSIGNQPKCWIRKQKKNYLLKADKYPIAMEAFTEKLASKLYNSTYYDIYVDKENDLIASICPNFMEDLQYKGKDFITANWYLRQFNYTNPKDYFLLLINEITKMGAKNLKSFIKMLIYDYIFLNADRHWDNFGFIKDNNKFEFAPLYDNGDCFGRNTKIIDANCYILKDYNEKPDYIINLLNELHLLPDYNYKDLYKKYCSELNNIISEFNNYDISEFINNKNIINKEILRRVNYLEKLKKSN